MASSRRLFLILLTTAASVLVAAAQAPPPASGDNVLRPVGPACSTSGNYTAGSQYATNLAELLAAMPAAAANNSWFYNGTAGNGTDTAYGLIMCFADRNATECQDCLTRAPGGITTVCPGSRTVSAAYDACVLRYSDAPLTVSDSSDSDAGVAFYVFEDTGAEVDDPGSLEDARWSLMCALAAAAAEAPLRLANGSAPCAGAAEDVFGLAQCTRDLTPEQCASCLTGFVDRLDDVFGDYTGGATKGYSCYVRYRIGAFDITLPPSSPSAPPPSTPSPPSAPPPSTSTPPSAPPPSTPSAPPPSTPSPPSAPPPSTPSAPPPSTPSPPSAPPPSTPSAPPPSTPSAPPPSPPSAPPPSTPSTPPPSTPSPPSAPPPSTPSPPSAPPPSTPSPPSAPPPSTPSPPSAPPPSTPTTPSAPPPSTPSPPSAPPPSTPSPPPQSSPSPPSAPPPSIPSTPSAPPPSMPSAPPLQPSPSPPYCTACP